MAVLSGVIQLKEVLHFSTEIIEDVNYYYWIGTQDYDATWIAIHDYTSDLGYWSLKLSTGSGDNYIEVYRSNTGWLNSNFDRKLYFGSGVEVSDDLYNFMTQNTYTEGDAMALEKIKLGGYVVENVEKINNNFAYLEDSKADKTQIPTKTSQLTNDSTFQTYDNVKKLVKSIAVTDSNGVFRVTYVDGTYTDIDTKLEKVVTNFAYDSEKQALVLTLEDGTAQEIPMSDFIDVYTGGTTTAGTVAVSTGNVITFTLASGAVAFSNLATAVQTRITDLEKVDHSHSNKTVLDNTTASYTTDEKTKLAGIASGATKVVVDTAMSSTSTNPVQNKLIYAALANKVDKEDGKGLSTNDYTTDEKNKLAGIATGANKYVHPASYTAKSSGFYKVTINAEGHVTAATAVTQGDITTLGIPTTDVATTSANGLMSNTDKSKLDGIASGANKTTVDASLSSTSTNPVQNKAIHTALGNKVDKVDGKGLSTNDYTTTEKNKLAGLSNYSLPTASSTQLGGVKVGSGLSISNGVLSVSTNGNKQKISFTTSSGWTTDTTLGTETYYKLTLTTNGGTPIAVYRKNASNMYEQVMCMISVNSGDTSATIVTLEQFEGYLLVI